MLKLLVGLDGSDHALHALRYAIRLANGNGPVSIHLVTVHEAPDIFGEIAIYVTSEKMATLQKERADAILAAGEALLREANVPYEREILIGHVPTMIAGRADELRCDGIVIGSRGDTAMQSVLLGSMAVKVAHLAKVPVTLVK
jgi:nucleotide-binding universal stress UspA family protein